MQTIEQKDKKVKSEKGFLERGFEELQKILAKTDSQQPDAQVQKVQKDELKTDSNSNTATAVLDPEDSETLVKLEGKKRKIKTLHDINEVEIKEIQSKKKVKIAKQSAKTFTFFETLITAKNAYFKYLKKHHMFLVIGTIALIGSVTLHELANVTILNKVFPDLYSFMKHMIATSVSVLFEALAITLVISKFKKASYLLDAVIVGMISWASYYELTVNKLERISAISRGIIGVSFFIGLMIIVHVIAKAEQERKRQKFEDLDKKKRREILENLIALKKTILDSKTQESKKNEKTGKESVRDIYNRNARSDFRAFCSSYNLKSSSLKKVSVRLGVYSNIFWKNPPKDNRSKSKGDKNKIKETAKKS